MYKTCKTEQSAARQRQLELKLLQVMGRYRFEDITVSSLCQHMGITRKTFYRYFSGKDGCLFALLDHTMLEFFTSTDVAANKKIGTAIGDLDRFFYFWYDHRDILDALHKSSLSGILVERATSLALRERLMPRYITSWSTNLQTVAMSFAVSGLLAMVTQWHSQGFSIPPKEMTRVATAMLTRPLIPM